MWLWATELHGRSGIGMAGALPLSPTTLADWSRLHGITLDEDEISALLQIDAALMVRSDDKHGDADETPDPPIAWPEKKHG